MTSWKFSAQLVFGLLTAIIPIQAALPEPPQQHKPWPLPSGTAVPDYAVRVAAALFDAGLADPRGGTYREVEIVNRYQGKDTLQTHAWVFPGNYAVCWNGLVYRVQTAGAPANLDRDVRAIVTGWANGAGSAYPSPPRPRPAEGAFWSALHANSAIMPASVDLLIRLGRTDLAAQLFPTLQQPYTFDNDRQREQVEAQWLAYSSQTWFASAYMRLVNAFDAENDEQAVDVAESILEWRSRMPAEISSLAFLDPVSELLVDARRRLREPKPARVDWNSVVQRKTGSVEFLQKPQAVRIAELIEDLEDLRGDKISFPGPLDYSGAPVYRLLKKEGEPAVDALIGAYENDRRLTRTFDYSRPWSVNYTPIPVHRVVEILLGDIVGDPLRIQSSSPAELRAWWNRAKSRDRAERSYEVLSDDRANPQQWIEAADFLTARVPEPPDDCAAEKTRPEINGRALQTRRNPSVTELLAKRTASLVDRDMDLVCSMAVKAALWDPGTAVPVLQQAATLNSCRASHLFAVARLSLGIPGAAADWVTEIVLHPKFPPVNTAELSRLWMFPNDPDLQNAAQWLFGRPDSPLSPSREFVNVDSPLLAVPAFRAAVVFALEDSTAVGRAGRTPEGLLEFQTANGGGEGGSSRRDPREAPVGQKRTIRVKGLVAWRLSNLQRAPEFGLDWPDPDKDQAIAAIGNFLRAHENQLHAFPMTLQDATCPGQRLYLAR